MKACWHRFLDWLLGPRCARGCGQRVFPRDTAAHDEIDHAGDQEVTHG